MSTTRESLVVLGVGNQLLGDDAVGLRVLDGLGRVACADATALPPDTCFIDGGTIGIDLMGSIEGARAVLVLDAVDIGAAPGEVVVLRGDAVMSAGARRPGGAAGGLGELLALARLMGWLTGPVALVGVQVDEVAFSHSLTPAVEAAVPAAVETARRTLLELDVESSRASRPTSSGVLEVTR